MDKLTHNTLLFGFIFGLKIIHRFDKLSFAIENSASSGELNSKSLLITFSCYTLISLPHTTDNAHLLSDNGIFALYTNSLAVSLNLRTQQVAIV
jgi:hypothetical protein